MSPKHHHSSHNGSKRDAPAPSSSLGRHSSHGRDRHDMGHSSRKSHDQALDTHSWHGPREARMNKQITSVPHATAKERLEEYQSTRGRSLGHVQSRVADSEDATLVQYLAVQSYHLPGNNWSQDWVQFMLNNHPVIGICCHHRKHPIKTCTRIVALIGSMVIGLAITNLFYLFYVWNPQFNRTLASVVVDGEEKTTFTTGMLLVWTLGGMLHATYNLFQWYVAACACCRPGGLCESQACCPSLGKHLLRVLVVVIISATILVVLIRVAIVNAQEDNAEEDIGSLRNSTDGKIHFFDDDDIRIEVHNVSEFEFVLGYFVETFLAFFVYYPIGGTILFSGCLGCGRIPILGGRPLEIRAEERRLARKQRRRHKQLVPSDDDWEDVEAVDVEHVRGGRAFD